jgi:hypothetical protein
MDVFFPMAGQGARFGHRFKPFLTIGDQLFIEAAVEPFRRFQSQIGRFVFVYLEAQEQEFGVTRRLQEVFSGLPIATVQLAAPTRGPAETIGRAIEQLREPVGAAFVCDCDHSLDVEPLLRWVSENPEFDALLPVWPLERENLDAWSVAMVEGDRVWGMSEKRLPDGTRGTAMGVIGGTPFIGLPGNPVASFVTFAHVARPAIFALSGTPFQPPVAVPLRAAFSYRKKIGRREYVRVELLRAEDGVLEAIKFPREGAGLLSSLVETHGLVELGEETTVVQPGQLVPFLPYSLLL